MPRFAAISRRDFLANQGFHLTPLFPILSRGPKPARVSTHPDPL